MKKKKKNNFGLNNKTNKLLFKICENFAANWIVQRCSGYVCMLKIYGWWKLRTFFCAFFMCFLRMKIPVAQIFYVINHDDDVCTQQWDSCLIVHFSGKFFIFSEHKIPGICGYFSRSFEVNAVNICGNSTECTRDWNRMKRKEARSFYAWFVFNCCYELC